MKIIQINGFRGLITVILSSICLFEGFIIFPSKVLMYLWNLYLVNLYNFPSINLLQGSILLGIIIIVYCLITKNDFALAFKNSEKLSDAELKDIISRSKRITPLNFSQRKIISSKIKEIAKNNKGQNNPFKIDSKIETTEEDKNIKNEKEIHNR